MARQLYFNAPVQLLQGAFFDLRKALNDICEYSIYSRCIQEHYLDDSESFKSVASSDFCVQINNKNSFLNGKKLFEKYANMNCPIISLRIEKFWEYYKANNLTEFDIACFLCYLAVKSIGGKSKCFFTNKKHIVARMFGYSNIKSIEDESELFHTYYPPKKSKLDRVLTELQINWHLKLYSNYERGFHLSFNKDVTLEYLAIASEHRKKDNKIKQLKKAKDDARLKAKNRFMNDLNNN